MSANDSENRTPSVALVEVAAPQAQPPMLHMRCDKCSQPVCGVRDERGWSGLLLTPEQAAARGACAVCVDLAALPIAALCPECRP